MQELSPAESAKEDGNAAFRCGNLEGALQAYSRVLELDAGMLLAANNRALVLLRLGQPGEAEVDLNKVCRWVWRIIA
jgi:Flp pilus assembly protein TadD